MGFDDILKYLSLCASAHQMILAPLQEDGDQEEPACADADGDKVYTTETPERVSKRKQRGDVDVSSAHLQAHA